MTSDTSERGLEDLIVRAMTGSADELGSSRRATAEGFPVAGGSGWILGDRESTERVCPLTIACLWTAQPRPRIVLVMDVKEALTAIDSGDDGAASRLLPLLYTQLRDLARVLIARTPPGQTLQPTALVHEAYLRLVGKEGAGWRGRAHFFAAAARAMRDILVEAARRKASLKRGGGRKRLEVEPEALAISGPVPEDLLALDEALRKLEADDPRKGQIVDLRFFAGLEMAEIAEVLAVSEATVKREWRYTRAWLHKELAGEKRQDG